MTLNAGTRLGPYEIVASLGAGGMGEVYRARDTKLNRDVAIKVLLPSVANDPDRLARFSREAQVLASLNHPNIAHIHGLEESDGVRALIMELVDGQTLADRIAKGALPLDETLPIAKQIAEALEAAHEQGIIHRDLKPANIKVRDDGTVKVLDFGLAKAMDPGGASSGSASMSPTITTPAMTQAGIILGTAAYMSPEQAAGKPVDKRSDLWAFGVVLLEMLTGRQVFSGETVSHVLASVLKDEPDWAALPPTTPTSIRRLLRRCLEKDRRRRLDSSADARLEIDETLAGAPDLTALPVSLGVARRHLSRRALPVVIGMSAAALITGTVVWNLRPPAVVARPTRFSIALADGQGFTGTARQAVAISADGTEMIYTANNRLYLRSMSDLDARPLPGLDQWNPLNPVFSPDGRWVAFYSPNDQTLKKTAVTGGVAVTLCRADAVFGMSWGPSGIVFGQGRKGILRVSENGGQPELLASVNDNQFAHGPQVLPDGQTLLFTLASDVGVGQWDKAQIVVQSLKTATRKVLVDGGSDARYLPTGHIVYVMGGVLFAAPFDLRRLNLTGGAVPIVEGVQRASSTGTAHFSVSATGSLVYLPGSPSASSAAQDLALIDRKGAGEPLQLPPGGYGFPRVSPNGKEVAFTSDDGKEAIIWVYELSGATAMRRLTLDGNNRYPVWSPNGQQIAFQSDREKDLAIFWQRADGVGTAERLTKPAPGTAHIPESWSPNGERLSFTVAKGSDFSLWMLSLLDRKSEPFGPSPVQSKFPINSAFSPDGRWIAYTSSDTGEIAEIYVQPYPGTGTRYQISRNLRSHHPFWSPDGHELWFVPGPGARFLGVSVATQPTFTIGNAVPWPRQLLLENGPTTYRNYDIMPDGKRIIGVIPAGQSQTGISTPRIQIVLNWFEDLKRLVPTK